MPTWHWLKMSTREALASDADSLLWCLQQPAISHHKLTTQRPDFFIISPPKTGSTWLAANLRCHPNLFIPDIKEVKYFSSFLKWLDLHWYLDHFAPAGDRLKGEASPSYAALPLERIRLIRRLMPDVKLIFLMREPTARAWSHAKHNYRYREASFASCTADFDSVPESGWRENLASEWALVSGDYLGQLTRWLTVFPREQMFVGFYESIASEPETLLREILAFLGLRIEPDLSRYRLTEKVLPGLDGELPAELREFLHSLWGDRTRELTRFLRQQLGMRIPPEWGTGLTSERGPCDATTHHTEVVFRRELDDRLLSLVIAQEEAFDAPPRVIYSGYRGYDLFLHRGGLYAVEQTPDNVHLDEDKLLEMRAAGGCLTASSPSELRERVDDHLFWQVQARLLIGETARTELREAQTHIGHLEEGLGRAMNEVGRLEQVLRKVEADAVRLAPLHVLAWRFARKLGRRMHALLLQKRLNHQNPSSSPACSATPICSAPLRLPLYQSSQRRPSKTA